jgi:hypothetical protein
MIINNLLATSSFSFEVRDAEKQNISLLLFCKSANEKREWLKDLKIKIKDYQIQRFVQSNSSHVNSSARPAGRMVKIIYSLLIVLIISNIILFLILSPIALF